MAARQEAGAEARPRSSGGRLQKAGGAESQQRGRPLGVRVQPARSRRSSYAAAGSEVGVAPAARDEWPGGCLDRRRPLHIHR